MNARLRSVKDVVRNMSQTYANQVLRAGPVLATLTIDANLRLVSSPTAPAPVATHLVRHTFAVWDDILKYLGSIRRQYEKTMGVSDFAEFAAKIITLTADSNRLLSLMVPLFIEGQMRVFSASPYNPQHRPQQFLIRLLQPIIECPDTPLVDPAPTRHSVSPTNATIVVVLIAGNRPFVFTCHPDKTIQKWDSYLEAATVLIIPQLVVSVASSLPGSHKSVMFSALAEEMNEWEIQLPKMGERTEWTWLPYLR